MLGKVRLRKADCQRTHSQQVGVCCAHVHQPRLQNTVLDPQAAGVGQPASSMHPPLTAARTALPHSGMFLLLQTCLSVRLLVVAASG